MPYLFVGPEGAGKETTALEIARRLNCIAPDRCTPEHRCESCTKALTFQHPDIRWIGPAPASIDLAGTRTLFEAKIANPFYQPDFAASSQVLIGDPDDPRPLTIRALIQFLRRQAFQGRWRVAIVADAHRLGKAAANAFLKTLEEPPPRSLIVLVTSNLASMLPTILSRCQRVSFEPYPVDELVGILNALNKGDDGAPAMAARLADGNARRAVALLQPEAQALWHWAGEVLTAVAEQRAGEVLVAAERLHAGWLALPDGEGSWDAKGGEAKDLARKRQRAILFCEMLAQLHADLVGCRERGDAWQPRDPRLAERLRRVAAGRHTPTLLEDIARIESARHEIDGNLNIGLCLAVLLQELIDHAQSDHASVAA